MAGVISNLLSAASAGLMAIFVVAALVVIDPVVASAALLGFGSIYAGVILLARKPLASNSTKIHDAHTSWLQTINEGLGGIRDILLDHSQEHFIQRFDRTDWAFRLAEAMNGTLGGVPRYLVESLGMVLIAGLAYGLTARDATGSGLVSAIPLLGALALGAQRLMPLLQQVYSGWSSVIGQKRALDALAEFIVSSAGSAAADPGQTMRFSDAVCFHNVSFRYASRGSDVLRDVNLRIGKGQRIGLIGSTGCGKSTALDLLMGLLEPTAGQITVDGVPLIGQARLAWQAHIGHVSQSIYLADCSIAGNIAFGQDAPGIDHQRVRAAAQQAQIADFIEALPAQYETTVGERGVRLSGGQRQRIGIARALYKNADVLVLDEATSALDHGTEEAVMDAISSLSTDITVILVAHRVSTLRNCDLIVEFRAGQWVRCGSYRDLIAS